MTCRVEKGVVFMGVAFRQLPGGRSRWRLPQSRDHALQGSTHCGYCVHGSHLLPMDHDRRNGRTPATRCATYIHAGRRVAVERAADRCTLICDEAELADEARLPSATSYRPDLSAVRFLWRELGQVSVSQRWSEPTLKQPEAVPDYSGTALTSFLPVGLTGFEPAPLDPQSPSSGSSAFRKVLFVQVSGL